MSDPYELDGVPSLEFLVPNVEFDDPESCVEDFVASDELAIGHWVKEGDHTIAARHHLPNDEQAALHEQIRVGVDSKNARDQLILTNLRLGLTAMRRLRLKTAGSVTYDDYVQEAAVSLAKVADTWEPSRGSFASYALRVVRNDLMKQRRTQEHAIRLPEHIDHDVIETQDIKYTPSIPERTEIPTDEDMVDVLGLPSRKLVYGGSVNGSTQEFTRHYSPEEYLHYLLALHEKPMVISYDDAAGQELSDTSRYFVDDSDSGHPEEVVIHQDQLDFSLKLLEKLRLTDGGERLADIVELIFGLQGDQPKTNQEIGEAFGFSKANASLLKQEALRRLRLLANDDTGVKNFTRNLRGITPGVTQSKKKRVKKGPNEKYAEEISAIPLRNWKDISWDEIADMTTAMRSRQIFSGIEGGDEGQAFLRNLVKQASKLAGRDLSRTVNNMQADLEDFGFLEAKPPAYIFSVFAPHIALHGEGTFFMSFKLIREAAISQKAGFLHIFNDNRHGVREAFFRSSDYDQRFVEQFNEWRSKHQERYGKIRDKYSKRGVTLS